MQRWNFISQCKSCSFGRWDLPYSCPRETLKVCIINNQGLQVFRRHVWWVANPTGQKTAKSIFFPCSVSGLTTFPLEFQRKIKANPKSQLIKVWFHLVTCSHRKKGALLFSFFSLGPVPCFTDPGFYRDKSAHFNSPHYGSPAKGGIQS